MFERKILILSVRAGFNGFGFFLRKGAKNQYKPEFSGVWGCFRPEARSRWLRCYEGGFRGADRGSRAPNLARGPKCKCLRATLTPLHFR